MTFRRGCLLVHRVNGLALAAFLTVSGCTGAILAFRAPLERLFAPQLFPTRGPQPPQPLDPVLVREQVAQAYPHSQVDMLDLSSPVNGSLEFNILPPPTATMMFSPIRPPAKSSALVVMAI